MNSPNRAIVLLLLITLWAGSGASQTAVALTVTGDVPTHLVLHADDLAKMPRQTVKGGYEGVLLRDILKRAGAPFGKDLRGKALAAYLLAKARDGYQVAFTLGEMDEALGNAAVVIADTRDGKPIAGEQGPLRLVCPGDTEGARSVRMLESIEVVRLSK